MPLQTANSQIYTVHLQLSPPSLQPPLEAILIISKAFHEAERPEASCSIVSSARLENERLDIVAQREFRIPIAVRTKIVYYPPSKESRENLFLRKNSLSETQTQFSKADFPCHTIFRAILQGTFTPGRTLSLRFPSENREVISRGHSI